MRKDAVQLAKDWALEVRSGGDVAYLFEIANQKALELAKRLGADTEIVQLGSNLMDIKLQEARESGKTEAHIVMGIKASRDFLEKTDLSEEKKKKVIECVAEHHSKSGKFSCLEAEICANADCYKFLSARGFFYYTMVQGKRNCTFNEAVMSTEKYFRKKLEILSLPECKAELEQDIKAILAFLEAAKR